MRGGRLPTALVVGLVGVWTTACGGEPTAPELPALRVLPVAGEGAYGVPGQELSFEAVVVRASDGAPRPEVAVTWALEAGDATLSASGSVSDDEGRVGVRVLLGSAAGPVAVRARVRDQPGAEALFTAVLGARPRLDSLSLLAAAPGETVALAGAGFGATPDRDIVLFSGIRGRILAATPERLEVEVPPCLPPRQVSVTVQVGALVSEARPLTVEPGGEGSELLAPGGWVDVADPAAASCLRLEGGAGYVLVAAAASTVAGARYPVVLRGLAGDDPETAAGPHPPLRAAAGGGGGWVPPGPAADPGAYGPRAALWDRELRVRERAPPPGGGAGPRAAVAPVPTVGDRRSFRVLNRDRELEEITAVARWVGEEAALFVDEETAAGALLEDDLEELGRSFERDVHPVVTDVFGSPSDIDGNDRIIVLFTPVVNRLTPRGSDGGFVAGFFFGLDLLEGRGGNDGEVFYAMVPDPGGVHSDPREKERVLADVPAVLAHEFQHMVHFNERALLRDGEGTGALWLSEGLAQMAEELVARRHLERGDEASVERFRRANRHRARRYLQDPTDASLVVAAGNGSLEERGASWLFTLYLADRWGTEVLGALTRTTRTGVDNVSGTTGAAWDELLLDWWAALLLTGTGGRERYGFEYPTVDPRTLLREEGEAWPFQPPWAGAADFELADTLWSASAAHYVLWSPSGAPLVVRLSGEDGADLPAGSDLGVRIVRLH